MILTKKTKQQVAEWKKIAEELKVLRKKESVLRDELVDTLAPNRTEGITEIELGYGYKLHITQPYIRDIDDELLVETKKKIKRSILNKLLRTKVSLNKKEYDNMDELTREIFNECIIVKPGKPQMKISEPKK